MQRKKVAPSKVPVLQKSQVKEIVTKLKKELKMK